MFGFVFASIRLTVGVQVCFGSLNDLTLDSTSLRGLWDFDTRVVAGSYYNFNWKSYGWPGRRLNSLLSLYTALRTTWGLSAAEAKSESSTADSCLTLSAGSYGASTSGSIEWLSKLNPYLLLGVNCDMFLKLREFIDEASPLPLLANGLYSALEKP